MVETLMSRFMREVKGCVMDMSTGRIGLSTKDSVYTLSGKGDSAQVEESPFVDFSVPVPVFGMMVPLAQVVEGDILVGTKGPRGWVIKKTAKTVTVMSVEGSTSTYTPKKVAFMGSSDQLMIARSPFNMAGGGDQNAMMQMAMMAELMEVDSDSPDAKKTGASRLMTMMLMQQMAAGGAGAAGAAGGAGAGAGAGMFGGNMLNMLMMSKLLKGGDFF